MTRTIITAVDASDGAHDALAYARMLCTALDAELVLACAYPSDRRRDHLAPHAAAELRARAQTALDHIGLAVPDAPKHALGGPSRAHALHDLAQDLHATALVLGSSDRAPLLHARAGHLGRAVVHGAPCAVAFAPRGFASTGREVPRRIVAGFDGCDESRHAVRAAIALSLASGATVDAVAVAEITAAEAWATAGGPVPGLHEALRSDLQAGLLESLEDAPIGADGEVLDGDAADVLRRRAAGADLVVLGSRGFGPVRAVLLGSVASQLMKDTPAGLMLVPRGVDLVPVSAPIAGANSAAAV